MDTTLSVGDIEISVMSHPMWNLRTMIAVPNVSWGLLNHEADILVISKSGYASEIEIKRSWEDFLADMKKTEHHVDERVYYFYYCVPASIWGRVMNYLVDNKIPVTGVFVYTDERNAIPILYHAMVTKEGPIVPFERYNGKRKLFLEEILTVARLGCIRYWTLRGVGISKL